MPVEAVINGSEAAQAAINSLQLGSLYALFALGVALIFGIMRLVNFAHGEFIMLGALILVYVTDWPLAAKIVVTLLGVVAIALLSERVVFRPLRGVSPVTLLVASFALSIGLQSVALLIVGVRPQGATVSKELNTFWQVGSVSISKLSIVTIVVTVLLLVGLVAFLSRHRVGVMMRAAAVDFTMTRLVGVRANLVIGTAFGISGLLAGVAAILIVAQNGTFTVEMGLVPVLFGFIASVVGGIGSIQGAVLGGYILGGASTALQVGLPLELKPFRDAFLFGAVLVFMVFRPGGLYIARSERTRV